MTKREAAIVRAYTGYLIGEFSDFHAYAEEIMRRPIFTHEFPNIADELKEKSEKDFISIKIEEEAPEMLYYSPFERDSWVDFDAMEKAAMEGYDEGYRDGKKDAINNLWSELQDRTEKIKQSNPPEFLTKCMNIRVPDCNDCGYLNYTEEEQQAYGINSYNKDHRCKCYDRPVYHYHRANSRKHNRYIHPCEECKKDSFVNYFDCESSKCNKKGE